MLHVYVLFYAVVLYALLISSIHFLTNKSNTRAIRHYFFLMSVLCSLEKKKKERDFVCRGKEAAQKKKNLNYYAPLKTFMFSFWTLRMQVRWHGRFVHLHTTTLLTWLYKSNINVHLDMLHTLSFICLVKFTRKKAKNNSNRFYLGSVTLFQRLQKIERVSWNRYSIYMCDFNCFVFPLLFLTYMYLQYYFIQKCTWLL